jgi:hypothetical protein
MSPRSRPAPSWTQSVWLLAAALLVQAAMLFHRLGLGSLWSDEAFTLETASHGWSQILRTVSVDIHPPAYFFLARSWLQVPLGWNPLEQVRALSAIFLLLALVAVDRLWLRGWSGRPWFLALWTASPCLLLYGRMGRSYSLQLLCGVVALRFGMDLVGRPREGRRLLGYIAAVTLLLYVHYVPGLALLAAVGVLLARQRAWRALLISNAVAAVAYLPWLATLAGALGKIARAHPYQVVHNPLADYGVKLAYWFVSFTFGECLTTPVVVVSAFLSPFLVWWAVRALRPMPEWFPLVASTAVIAQAGVAAWVSFPFMPARLLFLWPFWILLLVRGTEARGRVGRLVLVVWLAVSVLGVSSYYRKQGFLNKGYVAPYEEIARTINSGPRDGLVVIDFFNTDAVVARHLMRPDLRVVLLDGPDAVAEVRRLAPSASVVWHVANTHDLAPGRLNVVLDQTLSAGREVVRREYLPYSGAERMAMSILGIAERPTHFLQLLEYRRVG